VFLTKHFRVIEVRMKGVGYVVGGRENIHTYRLLVKYLTERLQCEHLDVYGKIILNLIFNLGLD